MNKKIARSGKAHASRSMGPHVRQVLPSVINHIDPFVFLDHFGPFERQPGAQGVPPHPHAGISTVTYLFSGSNRHQDSRGHDSQVHAGDIAWMQAGKGIVHAEGMNEQRTTPETVHGLQFWISLPAKDKFIEPAFYHYSSEQLPVLTFGNSTLKVLCGELLGKASPVKSLSPAFMYEVKMSKGETLEIPLNAGDTAGLYMVQGEVEVDETRLLPITMTSFETEGDSLSVTAIDDAHFMLFGGTPLNEPIVGYASYVMNSEEQILQVMQDYQRGKMGLLEV